MELSIDSVTLWQCPNCKAEDRTVEARPHTRMHTCPKLYGLSAPLLKAGTKAHVYTVERPDYVGKELVQTDGRGRPIMSIITEREDGQDCIVLAPTATGGIER